MEEGCNVSAFPGADDRSLSMGDRQMKTASRRDFLCRTGSGVLAAGFGAALLPRLALAVGRRDAERRLEFGALEPLVSLMQETPPDRLLAKLVARLDDGDDLPRLVAAGALANARALGGHDYDGYHAMMALMPSLEMARQMSGRTAALPVLKVLFRNTARIHAAGRAKKDTLDALEPEAHDVVEATRARSLTDAERGLVFDAGESVELAKRRIRTIVRDDLEVHRIVLAWRCMETLSVTGDAHAATLLRQIVRFSIDQEGRRLTDGRDEPEIRRLVPRLIAELGLDQRALGRRAMTDAQVEQLADVVYAAPRRTATETVAEHLGDGFDPEHVGESLTVASHRLLMRDPGRRNPAKGRPAGSVHGASVGVHALDSANAWRHLARHGGDDDRAATLLVGAYHTAGQSHHNGARDFDAEKEPRRTQTDPASLLVEIDGCIRAGDQVGACGAARAHATGDADPMPLFELLLGHAVAQDGALHAEKFYRTAFEEYHRSRPSFRGRYVVALTRVTASEHGFPAPGIEEARALLASG